MRKIIIKAKISDKAALLRKYETRDIAEDPVESFEVVIHDDSETLKELCNDPRVIHWSDKDEKQQKPVKPEIPKTEVPGIKEVAAVDLIKEGIKRNLKILDTRDMKTLLKRLMCLRNAIEWRAGSGMTPVTVVAESFGLPADAVEPVLSEDTVKLMLRRMASCSKGDFDKKLMDSMIDTTAEYFEHPEYLDYTPDYFLKKIFEYTWKETN
jgi:hypothetical protein